MINNGHLSRLFIILNIFEALAILGFAVDAPRPENGIFDQAKLLSEETEARLSQRLQTALRDHYLEVYVATYRIVKGETIAERAARLRNAWSRNPFAIVMVYDDSVGQMSLVGSRDLERFVSAQQLAGAFQRAAEVAKNFLQAEHQANRKARPEATIERALLAILDDPILTERMSLPERFQFTRPMAILLGVFIVLALVAAFVVVWLEARQARIRELESRCSYFPTTHMPSRLGAPYSGGQGISIGEE